MNIDEFWALIEPGKDDEEPEEGLRARLATLEPKELVSFQGHFDELFARAYRWDLWGAAYLIEGGCSDDGFTDFRYSLIAKGRKVYEGAIENPDSLVNVDIVSDEAFGYVAGEVFEDKAGEPMPDRASKHPPKPAGQQWDFDDSAECSKRLPKLSARFGG